MKIEKYLILNRYLLSLFGVNEFKELQEKLKDVRSDYNTEGRSRFVSALCGLSGLNEDRLSENSLLKYDEHIRFYTGKINYRREPKVLLKYFQYLSVLLMEIVLDNLQNRNPAFLLELNDFLKHHKKEHDIAITDDFAEEDLQKFAFWMATGSGKTLIM
ncbi:MAG: restriction endonuclease subunit R, partial [Proteobacteria bacterium]|nr:restriction endonuclease subunit R [Pseudomonadota bacterium]